MYVLFFASFCVMLGCGGLSADLGPDHAPDVVVNSLPAVADPLGLKWYAWFAIGIITGWVVKGRYSR